MADIKTIKQSEVTETEYFQLSQDRSVWLSNHCQIEPKKGGKIWFKLNDVQVWLDAFIDRIRANYKVRGLNKAVCVIILKARQFGISTWGLGYQYARCNTREHHKAMMAAHTDKASEKLFGKVQLFQSNNPDALSTIYSTKHEMKFAEPNGSSLWVATAGDDDLGRSDTIQDFHGSEFARWPNAEITLNSVMQCIPDDPDCTGILESTANGMGGAFCAMWSDCTPAEGLDYMIMPKGNTNWIGIFFPWHIFSDYSSPVEPDFEITTWEHPVYGNELLEAEKYGLSNEQLQWRRNTISNKCGSDIDLFRQEYPGNDKEAFLVTGRGYFPAGQLDWLAGRCVQAEWRGLFVAGQDGSTVFQESDSKKDVWELIEKPVSGRLYAIGADVAEGLDPNQTNNPEKTDRSVAHIIDVRDKRIVGKLRCRMNEDYYADQLVLAAKYYNGALLGSELNNKCGGAVLAYLKKSGYPNLYIRRTWDKREEKWLEKLLWTTDKFTKPLMLNDLRQLIRGEKPEYRPLIEIFSKDTIHELFSFITRNDGKTVAMEGEFDDEVTSLAITVQMAITAAGCMSAGEYAGSARENEVVKDYGGQTFEDVVCLANAIDNFKDLEDDYDPDEVNEMDEQRE